MLSCIYIECYSHTIQVKCCCWKSLSISILQVGRHYSGASGKEKRVNSSKEEVGANKMEKVVCY